MFQGRGQRTQKLQQLHINTLHYCVVWIPAQCKRKREVKYKKKKDEDLAWQPTGKPPTPFPPL